MSTTTIKERYDNAYPMSGDVAVLCEGDIIGFEVDLIEKWTAKQNLSVLVDVWACGTQDSIFGMADAIGRSRPLVIVEDRDYRTPKQATKDCKERRKKRLDRGNEVVGWQAWQRHEIENYLIEPAIVVPVLADWFQAPEEVVRERLGSVIECLRVDQAAQSALAQFLRAIPSKYPRYHGGLPKKEARPQWDAKAGRIVAPNEAAVKPFLEKELRNKAELFGCDCKKINANMIEFVNHFDCKCSEWNSVTLSSSAWLVEWAGKDILIALCKWLAAEYGFPMPHQSDRTQIDWGKLAVEKKEDEIERLIIHELQPDLVRSFFAHLPNARQELQDEWKSIGSTLQSVATR